MSIRSVAFAVMLAFIALLNGEPARADDAVRLLTAKPGWQAISVWYAKDLGLFAKHHVDMNHTSLNSSPAVMEAFISGQADMAVANVGTSVNAFFRGVPLRILDGTPASDYPLMTTSSAIKSIADLKGKKIAVWSVPSDATLAFNMLAKKQGLTAGTDFTFVKVPAQNVCDTMKRDQADAGIVFEPYASACLVNGARRISPSGTISFDPPKLVSSSVVIVNAAFLEKNPQAVKGVLEALDEAINWAAKNKEKAVESLSKYSGEAAGAIALSYDSANFSTKIDRGYHDILLQSYREAGLIHRAPTEADLKTLYQTNLISH